MVPPSPDHCTFASLLSATRSQEIEKLARVHLAGSPNSIKAFQKIPHGHPAHTRISLLADALDGVRGFFKGSSVSNLM